MMRINNGLDTLAIDNVDISVNFQDADGNSVLATTDSNNLDAKFFIRIDSMDNISDVSGAGSVAPGTTAEIHWLIIPSPGAAEDVPSGKLFFVGAHLSYTLGGVEESVDVTPDFITVKPLPKISLDYFLTREVVGDDAFTAEIEPSEPYTLGVRVTNNGIVAARNLKIDSAQPKIIEDEQGLAIGFQILSSSIDDQPAQPSLLIDFGEIPGNDARVGRWQMTTTKSGEFIEFDVSFSHADELGGQLTSLIEAAERHWLVQDVLVDLPGRDNVRDFFADDGDIFRVYESDGVDTVVADASAQAALTVLDTQPEFVEYRLTQPVAAGFSYVKLTDPHDGAYDVLSVTRSDGKRISLNNAWMSRSRNRNTEPPSWFYHLNLFDVDSTGSYTVRLGPSAEGPQPPIIAFLPDRTTGEGTAMGFLVESSDPNGDIPILTTAALPAGAAFVDNGDGTGYFNWTPGLGQAGSYVVRFEASDGVLSSSRSMTVTVLGDNDSDGDGMDDDWEMFWFETLARDGTGDFDGDGNTDLAEFQGSTDPARAPGPGQPEAFEPVQDEHVADRYPLLTVQNGAHGMTQMVGYYFEVFADDRLDELVGSSGLVAENSTGMTTWSVDTELDDNKTYYWRARAYDGATYSDWVYGRFFVNMANDAPGPFNISWPPSGDMVDDAAPTLSVTNATDPDHDALHYTFRVYADEAMSTLLAESEPVPQGEGGTTEWQLDIELADNPGSYYYWTVSVADGNGGTYESSPTSFYVDTLGVAPASPTDLYPAAGGYSDDWVDLGFYGLSVPSEPFASSYYFELDTVPTFDSPDLVQSGPVAPGSSSVSWGPSFGLVENLRYYWRVKATEGDMSSPWVTSYFTVNAVNEAPPVPYAGNPDFYGWSGTLTPNLYLWPVDDPDGNALSYEFELYTYSREHGVGEIVASAQTDVPEWQMPAVATDYGWYAWRARAIDEHGEASGWMAHVPIYVDNVLQPEILAMQALDGVTLTEGTSTTIDIFADGVSAPICYQVVGQLPSFAQFTDHNNGEGADLVLNPGYTDAGTYSVTVVAGHRGTLCEGETRTPPFEAVQQQFTATITNQNRAPIVTSPGPQAFAEGGAIELPIEVVDPDGDSVTIAIDGLPVGLSFDTSTSAVVGVIDYEAAGIYQVTINVADEVTDSLNATASFDIIVSNTNRAPKLTQLSTITVSEGQLVDIALQATDPDGDDLSYVVEGLPAGVQLGDQSGAVAGSPEAGTAGNYDVVVTVADNGEPSLSDTGTFSLVVLSSMQNIPPSVAITSPADGSAEVYVGDTVLLSAYTSDEDGSIVEVQFLIDGIEVGSGTASTTQTYSLNWSPSVAGNYAVTAVAIDDDGASATSSAVFVEVVEAPEYDPVETYFVLNPSLSNGKATVVSLEDNNVIRVGGTELQLNRYERGRLPAAELVQGAKITGTGPFDVASNVNATDSPVPLKLAGTQFVIPHVRHTHLYYLLSPFGDAVANIRIGDQQSSKSLPKGVVIEFNAGAKNNISGVVESDLPILVAHRAVRYINGETFMDAMPIPPAGTELWGIQSTLAYVGAIENETVVNIYADDGTYRENIALSAGERYQVSNIGSKLGQGAGSALRIVSNKPIGAIQHTDGDGQEETAFLPTTLLGRYFGVPIMAQYISVVCTQDQTNITLYRIDEAPETKVCVTNGDFPGHVYFGSSGTTRIQAGASIETNAPVYIIYDNVANDDEHNLIGFSPFTAYVVNPDSSAAGAKVMSFQDNAVLRVGANEIELNRDDVSSLPADALVQGAQIVSTRSVSIVNETSGTNSPVSRSLMGQSFVVPQVRGAHRYYLLSPDADAEINMTLGETSDSLTLPKGQVVEYSVTDQNSHSLIVRANRPIFLTHRAVDASGTVYTDAMSVPPAAKALWGIGSTSVFIGAIEDETVVWARREGGQSGSDMISVELNAGDRYDLSNFVESGVGAALYLAANKPIGAVRTGGSGGLDEGLVSLTPKNLFAARFALPSAAERVVVGCIHDQTQVVLYQPDQSPQIVQCDVEEMTGSVVLQSVAGSTSITPGSYIETTLPVFAAFKSAASNEENNLFGERLLNPAP